MLLSNYDINHYIRSNMLRITGSYDIQNCCVDLSVKWGRIVDIDEFCLLETANIVTLPTSLAGVLGGRSSYARKGLMIHCTSALIAPGFSGHIVLEVKNISNKPIVIYNNEKICSLSFMKMMSPATEYDGRYQGQ